VRLKLKKSRLSQLEEVKDDGGKQNRYNSAATISLADGTNARKGVGAVSNASVLSNTSDGQRSHSKVHAKLLGPQSQLPYGDVESQKGVSRNRKS